MSPERKARLQALLEPLITELHMSALEASTRNERDVHEGFAIRLLAYSALLERKSGRGGQHQMPVVTA